MTEKEIEQVAKDFRSHVRRKAGLSRDWDDASEDMKEFYRQLARKL